MRPKHYPYTQKRPLPSQERVASYRLAIEELNSLAPTASETLKKKIEEVKNYHLSFLKPFDLDFLLNEQELPAHAD